MGAAQCNSECDCKARKPCKLEEAYEDEDEVTTMVATPALTQDGPMPSQDEDWEDLKDFAHNTDRIMIVPDVSGPEDAEAEKAFGVLGVNNDVSDSVDDVAVKDVANDYSKNNYSDEGSRNDVAKDSVCACGHSIEEHAAFCRMCGTMRHSTLASADLPKPDRILAE